MGMTEIYRRPDGGRHGLRRAVVGAILCCSPWFMPMPLSGGADLPLQLEIEIPEGPVDENGLQLTFRLRNRSEREVVVPSLDADTVSRHIVFRVSELNGALVGYASPPPSARRETAKPDAPARIAPGAELEFLATFDPRRVRISEARSLERDTTFPAQWNVRAVMTVSSAVASGLEHPAAFSGELVSNEISLLVPMRPWFDR